ncbi:DUF6318 family protein [Arsenicicoccus sp. UBA7492]|uniref:DUF6318 family protein n=1 Tax=Arsenicicoccus sp. UBA7492 TaxID=1946057 RepID=UPI00257E95BB|nr:DUF6318 family protein [Arsenicicoccus sp. UBA7492]
MRGHGRLLTAAGLITAGALAGCSGAAGTSQGTATATHELPPATPGTSAATPTSSSAATTSSTSPTTAAPAATSAAAPAIPAAARAHTPEGAEAFTRYFIDQVNVAWTTPKTGLISALSLPTCKSCTGLEEGASELAGQRSRYTTPVIALRDVLATSDPKGQTVVKATVVESPSPVAQGRQTSPAKGQTVTTRRGFVLAFAGNAWRVSEIGSLQ